MPHPPEMVSHLNATGLIFHSWYPCINTQHRVGTESRAARQRLPGFQCLKQGTLPAQEGNITPWPLPVVEGSNDLNSQVKSVGWCAATVRLVCTPRSFKTHSRNSEDQANHLLGKNEEHALLRLRQ